MRRRRRFASLLRFALTREFAYERRHHLWVRRGVQNGEVGGEFLRLLFGGPSGWIGADLDIFARGDVPLAVNREASLATSRVLTGWIVSAFLFHAGKCGRARWCSLRAAGEVFVVNVSM
jgi:hypothetical protein